MLMKTRNLILATILFLPLTAMGKPTDGDPEDEPLKRSDLPLPVVIDETQGDVPITLDGETVNISGTVSASLNEPVEIEGTVNATIDEPLEVFSQLEYAQTLNADEACVFYHRERGDLSGPVVRLLVDLPLGCNYITEVQLGIVMGGSIAKVAAQVIDASPAPTSAPTFLGAATVLWTGRENIYERVYTYPRPLDFTGFADPFLQIVFEEISVIDDDHGWVTDVVIIGSKVPLVE